MENRNRRRNLSGFSNSVSASSGYNNRAGLGHGVMSREQFLKGASLVTTAVAAAGLGWGGVARADWPDTTNDVVSDGNGGFIVYPSGTQGTTLYPHPLNGSNPPYPRGPLLGAPGNAKITEDALHVQQAMLNAAPGATIWLKSTLKDNITPAEFRFGNAPGALGSFGVRITKDVKIIGDTNPDGTPATVIAGGMVPIGCALPLAYSYATCANSPPPGPEIEIKNIHLKNYLRFLNNNLLGIAVQFTNGATIDNCKFEIEDPSPWPTATVPATGAYGIVFNHTNPLVFPAQPIPVSPTCKPINITNNHFIGTNTAAGIGVIYFCPVNCPSYNVSNNKIELNNSSFQPGNDYGAIFFYGNVVNAICNNNTIVGTGLRALSLLRLDSPDPTLRRFPQNCKFSGNDSSGFEAKVYHIFVGPYSSGNYFGPDDDNGVPTNIIGSINPTSGIAGIIEYGSNNSFVMNDFTMSGIMGKKYGSQVCVLLTEYSNNDLVFQSGTFPSGTGGAKDQVVNLGFVDGETTNRVVGHPNKYLASNVDRGIGQRLQAIEAQLAAQESLIDPSALGYVWDDDTQEWKIPQ